MSDKRDPADFNSEIESHIQIEADRLREQGMSEEDAMAEARRAFGNVTSAQERFYESGRWLWWDTLLQDVRYAFRAVRNNKVFTILAALSLALGIGTNTAIFSFMDSILFRALPVQNPELLVMLNWRSQPRSSVQGTPGRSGPYPFVAHSTMNSSGASYNDPQTGYH